MTRQGHHCALISVSIYPPVNRWLDSCALHPRGRRLYARAFCPPRSLQRLPSITFAVHPKLDSVRVAQTKEEMESGSRGGSEH